MKALIAITDKKFKDFLFEGDNINRLKALCDVEFLDSDSNLINRIKGKDIVITGWDSPKLTKEVLEKADSLKFYGHTAGTVVPYIDPVIFKKGIKVVNANEALARSTAECTLMLMLSGSWHLIENMEKTRLGIWSSAMGKKPAGLYSRTIGIIGLGVISTEVIRLLKPFHSKILLHSLHCTAEEAKALDVELCSLEYLLKNSDIISLHDTLTEETRNMIGDKELSLIRDGALLVNTARGPIIEAEALKKHLSSGRIYGAMDVYSEEPLPQNSIWTQLDNVIATPHFGGHSEYWVSRLVPIIIEDIERFIQGQPILHEITEERFSRLTLK
jgi:phosphoglycerate dehydrogenase-like enzyme